MGMFDNIKLEEPIKCKCEEKINDFQTKDLNNMLETYIFTKDNRFKTEIYKFEGTDDDRRGFYLKKNVTGEKYLDITDTIYFYTSCDKCNTWIGIKAIIVDGKVRPFEIEFTER